MINQIDFKNLVPKYGKPIVVSPNGRFFVFRKDFEQLDELENSGYT